MREIRFRFWEKNVKRMERCVELNPFYIGDGDRLRWNRDEVELMQYTGLKDRNGVEIYEGDIVKCKIYSREYIGKVTYAEMLAVWFLTDMERSDSELWLCDEKEVVGNIYENPELLEVSE